jgi:hypothetical protein
MSASVSDRPTHFNGSIESLLAPRPSVYLPWCYAASVPELAGTMAVSSLSKTFRSVHDGSPVYLTQAVERTEIPKKLG